MGKIVAYLIMKLAQIGLPIALKLMGEKAMYYSLVLRENLRDAWWKQYKKYSTNGVDDYKDDFVAAIALLMNFKTVPSEKGGETPNERVQKLLKELKGKKP